jgi:cytochrome P450
MLLDYARRWAQPGLLDLLLPREATSPLDVGRAAFRRDWLRLIDRIIDVRLRQPAAPDQPRDLFDMLHAARDPDTGAGFDRALLRDEVATMILAGHETTAVALFWACLLAAQQQPQQAALAAEANNVDLSPGAAGAALRALPLARAHLDETMRLYPPAFLITREAIGPDVVGGLRVAPGTVISISPWVIHRHRLLWRNPDGFDPARFRVGAPPPRFAYLPFGAGPRICVGMQFALTEAVLVMARLLRRFRMEIVGGRDVAPRGFVTTQPDRPVRFLLTRRGVPAADTRPRTRENARAAA